MSLDLTVLSIQNGSERWRRSRSARVLQVKDINERVDVEAHGVAYVELQLASWLIDQLDAHTVAAIAWQVLRRATGIAKRLAIYLAAHSSDFEPITRHTERFVVPLTDRLYEEFGIAASRERERDRRASLTRAAHRPARRLAVLPPGRRTRAGRFSAPASSARSAPRSCRFRCPPDANAIALLPVKAPVGGLVDAGSPSGGRVSWVDRERGEEGVGCSGRVRRAADLSFKSKRGFGSARYRVDSRGRP